MISETDHVPPAALARGRSAAPGVLEARPLYLQARDLLVQRIIAGVWKPGHYLPSETRLAHELGVSIGTIRKATEDLVEQGILERLHGRGTRVAAHSRASTRFRFLRLVHPDGRPFNPVGRLLRRSLEKPSPDEQLALEIPVRTRVLVLLRQRCEDDLILVVERIVLQAATFERLELRTDEDMQNELYVLYQEQCGVTIVRTQDQIGAAIPDAEVARLLQAKAGVPMLRIRRVAYTLDGRPAELRESWTTALRYQTELE